MLGVKYTRLIYAIMYRSCILARLHQSDGSFTSHLQGAGAGAFFQDGFHVYKWQSANRASSAGICHSGRRAFFFFCFFSSEAWVF